MITHLRRATLSRLVTRHFEFSRLQDQLIASAYHTLIPAVARPLGQPRSRCGVNAPAAVTIPSLRTKAEGA
jgi:hypothetical protein